MRLERPRVATAIAFVIGVVLAAALLPAGVTAASTKDVFAFITDPDDNARQAKVTDDGALKVTSSGTATVGGTVNVGNLPAATQPFQAASGGSTIEDGQPALQEAFSVPAGKRLTIQHVSGQITLPPGQEPFGVVIFSFVGGSDARHFIGQPEPKSVAGYFHFGEEIAINADPGTTVRVVVSRFGGSLAGAGVFQWTVSGYLTDA